MRFAYIDSQGNEVSIPSVDALALRIELGAIGPDTQLYDAQADRWGPAHTHEIFHTLSRDASTEGGFVAPPPPVAAPSEPDTPAPAEPKDPGHPAVTDARAGSGHQPPEISRKRFNVAEDLGLPSPEPQRPKEQKSGGGGGDLGFDFTLTDAPASTPEDTKQDPSLDMDLTLAEAPEAGETSGDDPASFSFGDLSPLDVERDGSVEDQPPEALERVHDEDALDFSGGDAGSMDFGDDDEGALDFSSGPGTEEGLDLEPPMSDFSPDSPPAWLEETGAADQGNGALDFGPKAPEDDPADDRPARPIHRAARDSVKEDDGSEPPRPRSRPSPPKRIRRKSPTGLIGGVVALVVLGGGGYLVFTTFLQGRGGSADVTAPVALPPVTIPDIPADLLPEMRDLGQAALGGTIAQFTRERAQSSLPAEPNGDWLAGVYLANAGRFRDVQEYWQGFGSFVDHVRDNDTRVFHDQYVAALDRAGILGDTASMLLARADSGFLATRQDRFEAYKQMDDLVNAALDLHRFLLLNEASIAYTPAAGGVSEDPVLEAVPASKELGDQMWSMVDRITSALDVLGSLDKVTTERLSAVLFDRIRRAGFR